MNCMKCGVEIPEGQVFCDPCLEVMATHPVPPGIHVQLPRRPAKTADRKAKELTPEAQIVHLNRAIRWLLVTVGVLTAAVVILALLVIQKPDTPQPQPVTGRNYTTTPR